MLCIIFKEQYCCQDSDRMFHSWHQNPLCIIPWHIPNYLFSRWGFELYSYTSYIQGKYFLKCWSEVVRKDSPFEYLGRKLNCHSKTWKLLAIIKIFTAKFDHTQFKIHCLLLFRFFCVRKKCTFFYSCFLKVSNVSCTFPRQILKLLIFYLKNILS